MRIRVPSPLFSYTDDRAVVEADGATLRAVLADLDARYKGMRFRIVDEQDRIRPHIKVFIGGALAATLDAPVAPGQEIMIVAALSGG